MESFKKLWDEAKKNISEKYNKVVEKIEKKLKEINNEPNKALGSKKLFDEIVETTFRSVLDPDGANVEKLKKDIAVKLVDVLNTAAAKEGKEYVLNIDLEGADYKDPTGADAYVQFVTDCVKLVSKAFGKNDKQITSGDLKKLSPDDLKKLSNDIFAKHEYYTKRNKASVVFNAYKKYWKAFYELFSNKQKIEEKLLKVVDKQVSENQPK